MPSFALATKCALSHEESHDTLRVAFTSASLPFLQRSRADFGPGNQNHRMHVRKSVRSVQAMASTTFALLHQLVVCVERRVRRT